MQKVFNDAWMDHLAVNFLSGSGINGSGTHRKCVEQHADKDRKKTHSCSFVGDASTVSERHTGTTAHCWCHKCRWTANKTICS